MVKFIAAVDSKLGIADEHGIPWHGQVPSDVRYYHKMLETGTILMGYGVYVEISKPYGNKTNYVASSREVELRPGFEIVRDARVFLQNQTDDVWNIGGALLFGSTMDLADELYLTRLDRDFHCTKFFPQFENEFELKSSSQPLTENGITFHFEIWRRK